MPPAAREALLPLTAPVSPVRKVLFLLEPARVRFADWWTSFLLRNTWLPRGLLGFFAFADVAWSEVVYGGEISSTTRMLQNRQRVLGNEFVAFGSVVHCGGNEAFELMERTPATFRRTNAFVGQYAQADILSPHTFLFTEGPRHDRDKQILIDKVIAKVTPDDWAAVDAMLGEWRRARTWPLPPKEVDAILVRCAHRLLLRLDLDEAAVALCLGWQGAFFSPALFIPLGIRRALLKGPQRKLDEGRQQMTARYRESPVVRELFPGGAPLDGLPLDDFVQMMFEALNVNAAAILSNSQRVVRVLAARPDLVELLRAEHKACGLDAPGPVKLSALAQADRTRRFALEVMRIYTRVATISWRSDAAFEVDAGGRRRQFPAGTLRTASIANANVDPALYPEPYEIRLDRDYSRTSQFGGVNGPRRCPGRDPSLTMISLVTVHLLRPA